MSGAIFYGSTANYARWIADADGLPVALIRHGHHTPFPRRRNTEAIQ